jgi:nucleoid-associated protein YgaU
MEKALITNSVTLDKIPVLFNPEEYTLNKDINFAQAAIPGLSGPILQFVNGNMSTLEMELLVDSYEAHEEGATKVAARSDVRDLTTKITNLMEINSDTHAPPLLIFTWGKLSFQCVLARVSQRFIMFLPDGTPVRARLSVTFHEYLDPEFESKRVNTLTADFSKEHVVLQGETLSKIAAKLYEDPQLWRPIAIFNRIADPRSLRAGQRLRVPSMPFTDPDTGERFG